MSIPKSVTKITKDGIEFTSNVEQVNYTIKELSRAALRDVGKFVCREFKKRFYEAFRKRSGKVGKYTQYWVKYKKEEYPTLQVGLKPNGFYGGFQEVGSSKTDKKALLQKSVEENIDKIIQIESKYLSALEDEAEALSMISEEDYEGGEEN